MLQEQGSGGLAAVSVGISESLVAFVLLVAVVFGVWKLAKLVWAALSG